MAFTGCEIVVKPGMRGRLVEWLNRLAVAAATVQVHRAYRRRQRSAHRRLGRADHREPATASTVGFCFGDDLDPAAHAREPVDPHLHDLDVIRRLGYMGPPRIQHMYVDPVWYAWGQATSIEFLPDVVLEHMHYSLGRRHGRVLPALDRPDPAGLHELQRLLRRPGRHERRHPQARRCAVHAGGDGRVQPAAEHPARWAADGFDPARNCRPARTGRGVVESMWATTEGHDIEIVVAVDGHPKTHSN
jgi:hypothetical protein